VGVAWLLVTGEAFSPVVELWSYGRAELRIAQPVRIAQVVLVV